MSKKSKLIITQTLVTDGKIILSAEELVELIRLKYPEFPIGECVIEATYGSRDHSQFPNEIIVESIKSEKHES